VRRRIIFFGVILLASATGFSAMSEVWPTVIGAGADSCGTWTSVAKTYRRLEYEAWLIGYFSAVNRYAAGANGI
jgi:hypothetical protein